MSAPRPTRSLLTVQLYSYSLPCRTQTKVTAMKNFACTVIGSPGTCRGPHQTVRYCMRRNPWEPWTHLRLRHQQLGRRTTQNRLNEPPVATGRTCSQAISGLPVRDSRAGCPGLPERSVVLLSLCGWIVSIKERCKQDPNAKHHTCSEGKKRNLITQKPKIQFVQKPVNN